MCQALCKFTLSNFAMSLWYHPALKFQHHWAPGIRTWLPWCRAGQARASLQLPAAERGAKDPASLGTEMEPHLFSCGPFPNLMEFDVMPSPQV